MCTVYCLVGAGTTGRGTVGGAPSQQGAPAKYQDKWIRGSGGVAVVRWRGLEDRARLRQGSAGRVTAGAGQRGRGARARDTGARRRQGARRELRGRRRSAVSYRESLFIIFCAK